jgi:hypothetical protein
MFVMKKIYMFDVKYGSSYKAAPSTAAAVPSIERKLCVKKGKTYIRDEDQHYDDNI